MQWFTAIFLVDAVVQLFMIANLKKQVGVCRGMSVRL